MNKRITGLFVIAVMLVSIGLNGCKTSPNTSSGSQNSTVSEENITLRLFTSMSDESPASKAFRDRVALFMEQNKNITVLDESINDEASFNNKWKAAVATGNVPDLFSNYGGAKNKEYARNKVFADISAEVNADTQWRDAFKPTLLNTWEYSDIPGIYGIPYEFYATALFYNKDLFAQINSEPPKTLDEFKIVSDKFIAKDIIPMAIGEKDFFKGTHLFTLLVLKKFGTQIMQDLASRTVKYDSPEIIDIFTQMNDMNKKGYLGKNIVGVDYNAENALFLNEKTAMHFDGSWFLSEAEGSSIASKIGITGFPYYTDKPANKDTWMGGSGAGISISGAINGNQRAAAIKLLKFVTSAEYFQYLQKTTKGGVYPVDFEASASDIGPVTASYITAISTVKAYSLEPNIYDLVPAVPVQLENSLQGLFAGGTPEKAAKEIADEAKK